MYPSALPLPSPAASATTRVYQYLKRAILEQLHPGGALLTEAEIAEAVGVSRTPVREALLRLEAEGLVALYPKRGALVLPVSAQEIDEVIEARTLVEGHAASRIWARRAELGSALEPLLEAMRKARAAADAIAFMEADRAFHATVVDLAGNSILADLYHRLRDRQMRMGVAVMRISPDRMDRALADHAEMLAALGADSPERFTRLVHDHVATAAGNLRGPRA
ncbi:GntR family transcriptional regulator [Planosporangium flavigriseum]|uniref:GntR family transcriptional regulator n=1 Tax=Planosporangium flavigriseum TaxID=373681 RepID=A0A8J3LZL2_9ACTN|nr:GntR family transcriptional regulator [Planosporangium flavigriseum]NJC68024.1 GntR family transcriptional regulator [Planosporangium flavigriseum]GIG76659.1 GntR family transcriptional regulator [Planosporangium flavigriseum]